MRHRRAIVDVLLAYVVVHAPWPPRLHEEGQPAKDVNLDDYPLRTWAPDVQAAVSVLARHAVVWCADLQRAQPELLSLRNVDLRRAELTDANLQKAVLGHAGLERVVLRRAKLQYVRLNQTSLKGANLRDAQLQHANLREADLSHADLGGADLADADLHGAVLYKARLWGANLRSVRNLDMAQLQECSDTVATTWPPDFDPLAHGVRRQQ